MGLLQYYVNTPALCYNMIQREQHHLDRLQNTLTHSWELVSESQNIIEPMELATQLFVVFLISVYTYLLTLIIWSKTCFPCIPPSGIKVLGEEAYSTYLSLATEESAICQNMNKWALVISQWVIYIQAGQVWYFSEKLCPLLECFS